MVFQHLLQTLNINKLEELNNEYIVKLFLKQDQNKIPVKVNQILTDNLQFFSWISKIIETQNPEKYKRENWKILNINKTSQITEEKLVFRWLSFLHPLVRVDWKKYKSHYLTEHKIDEGLFDVKLEKMHYEITSFLSDTFYYHSQGKNPKKEKRNDIYKKTPEIINLMKKTYPDSDISNSEFTPSYNLYTADEILKAIRKKYKKLQQRKLNITKNFISLILWNGNSTDQESIYFLEIMQVFVKKNFYELKKIFQSIKQIFILSHDEHPESSELTKYKMSEVKTIKSAVVIMLTENNLKFFKDEDLLWNEEKLNILKKKNIYSSISYKEWLIEGNTFFNEMINKCF